LHEFAAFFAAWERQVEMRGEVFQLGRQGEFVADEDQRPWVLAVTLANVFDQPHVHRIVEERVKVEQYIGAGLGRGANRLQHIGRFGVVGLRSAEIDVEPSQALGDLPLEHRQVAALLNGHGRQ
jgi:hypothetical protein